MCNVDVYAYHSVQSSYMHVHVHVCDLFVKNMHLRSGLSIIMRSYYIHALTCTYICLWLCVVCVCDFLVTGWTLQYSVAELFSPPDKI